MSSSKRKFKVFDGITTTEIFPVNDSSLAYTWDFDDEKIFYKQKLKSQLIFGNNKKTGQNDFDLFYAYHTNPLTACLKLLFTIYKLCDGEEVVEWIGEFASVDGSWDLDKCLFTVKPNDLNKYTCLDKQKNVEVNILDVVNKITTSANLQNNFEFFYCATFGGPTCPLPGPNPTAWTTFYTNFNYPFRVGCVTNNIFITIYYREFAVVPCVGGVPNPPMGSGWLLETNDCITLSTSKYVRNPLIGPFPYPTQTQVGWYNLALGQDEEPPYPSFQTLQVSANPASEELEYVYPRIIGRKAAGGIDPTWYMSVPNNPNSTYAWSLDGTSTIVAIVTGVTNEVAVTPNNPNSDGTIVLRLTETHGNASVSIKLYSILFVRVDKTNDNYTLTLNSIVGPNDFCKNQKDIRFSIPKQPDVVPNGFFVPSISAIVWTVNNGAVITSGQGTRFITVDAGTSNFDVSATWTVTVTNAPQPNKNYQFHYAPVKSLVATIFPNTPIIRGISNRYPSEPNLISRVHTRLGASYAWYDTLIPAFLSNGTLVGGFNEYVIPTPASNGTYCYLVKETVNCGCLVLKKVGAGYVITQVPFTGMGYFPPIYWCESNSITTDIDYTRNRIWFETIEYILAQIGCDPTTVVSDFFEWNPPGDTAGYVAGINYVTGLPNKLSNITISQKSDVITPTSSNAATKGLMTWDKTTLVWKIMFNAYWFIDNLGRVRVEHISWFNKILAFDTTINPSAIYNVAKRKYDFDKSKMPRFEKFLFAEQRTTDITGADIYYDSLCVNQDSKSNTVENAIPFITTDLYYIFQSPSEINPQGFVLFCNQVNLGVYTVDIEIGNITGQNGANFHFGWANLHVNFHKYRRVLLQGFMNNILTNFVTAKRTKQQKDLILVICCEDNFDPSNILIRSELGDGILDSAEYTVKKGVMTISLFHDNNL